MNKLPNHLLITHMIDRHEQSRNQYQLVDAHKLQRFIDVHNFNVDILNIDEQADDYDNITSDTGYTADNFYYGFETQNSTILALQLANQLEQYDIDPELIGYQLVDYDIQSWPA